MPQASAFAERRRVDGVLGGGEDRFRSFFERGPVGKAITTPDGVVLRVNAAFASMLGYSAEELRGRSIAAITHKDDREETRQRARALLAGEADQWEMDTQFIRKDGSPLWTHAITCLERDVSGKPLYVLTHVQDIGPRKEAEEAQRRLRALLDQTQALTKVGGWEYDVATRRVEWTDEVYRIHGVERATYDPNEIGRDIAFYAPEDQKRIAEAFQKAVESGEPYDLELRFRTADGVPLWVRTIGRTESKAGRVRRVYGNIMDITDRVRAERTLGERDAFLKNAEKALGIGTWIFRAEGQGELTWSPAVHEIFGVSEGDCGGRVEDFFSRVHPDDVEIVTKSAQASLETDTPYRVEHRVVRPDGGIRWVSQGAVVERNKDGRPLRMLGVIEDITARKKAEEEVARASAYNRRLLEASLDPLVTISPDGKIMDLNRATEEATGASRQELIGTDFSEYFVDAQKAREAYQRAFCEGRVQDYELTIRRRDGYLTPVIYNAAVYRDATESVVGVFAAARDITARKRAETALQEKARDLERSNVELEQFAYIASHDLQEPLRMVANFTQLLGKRYGDELGTEGAELIAFAVEGATRMSRLIDDLLTYSRVGTRRKAFETTDCNEAFEEAMANLQMGIRESGAIIHPGDLPTVIGDPSQLIQVFQNLVGNAIKFRSGRAPEVHVAAERRGNDWLFSVRDNGIGIDPQFADRIFVMFQRLHTREAYSGTGIGLAICKKIVERHGGRIWVESEPGVGSTFFFTIPAAQEAPAHA